MIWSVVVVVDVTDCEQTSAEGLDGARFVERRHEEPADSEQRLHPGTTGAMRASRGRHAGVTRVSVGCPVFQLGWEKGRVPKKLE